MSESFRTRIEQLNGKLMAGLDEVEKETSNPKARAGFIKAAERSLSVAIQTEFSIELIETLQRIEKTLERVADSSDTVNLDLDEREFAKAVADAMQDPERPASEYDELPSIGMVSHGHKISTEQDLKDLINHNARHRKQRDPECKFCGAEHWEPGKLIELDEGETVEDHLKSIREAPVMRVTHYRTHDFILDDEICHNTEDQLDVVHAGHWITCPLCNPDDFGKEESPEVRAQRQKRFDLEPIPSVDCSDSDPDGDIPIHFTGQHSIVGHEVAKPLEKPEIDYARKLLEHTEHKHPVIKYSDCWFCMQEQKGETFPE